MKMSITTYLEDIINDPEINQWKKYYTSLELKEIKDIIPDIKEITTEKKETKEIGIENIIYEKENVCLIGEAGCGKTTSLRYLTLMLAQKEDEDAIPLYADLTNFTSAYTDFEEFIEYILNSRSFPIDTAKELLGKGHFVIFVDSLDALSIERIDLIGKFMLDFPNSRFIFSSREGGYYERLHIKKKWDVLPLDDEKKKACVERYIEKEEADEFFDEIKKSPQKDVFEALISNPLMLWMTAEIFADNRKLPENRTEIYQKYIRYFYEHNKKRQVEITHERHIIEDALSEIAFFMLCNNKFSIEEESVYEFLKEVKNDCIKLNFVSVIEDESGNFVKIMPHPSFQEYFCAVKLKNLYETKIDISVTFTHPRWENVLLFLSGMLEASSALVKVIMRYNLSLASKCIESGKVDHSVITDAIKKLHVLAESNFSYDRTIAMGSLGRIGSDESVDILINGLEDSDVRWCAADALGEIKSERAVEGLLQRLSDDESDVRWRAAGTLASCGKEKDIYKLETFLSDAKGYDFAYDAIQIIKLRETQEIKLRVTKRSIQKKEGAEKIKDFTTELNKKEFVSISLNDLSCSEQTKDYRSIKLYCKYLNPLYPCIVQYFNVKNLYSIRITVKNESDLEISDVKVSYKIGGLVKDYETLAIADILKKGVQESKGFIIDPKSIFGYEASKTSLIVTISFKDKEKQESEYRMPLTIASKNSIVLSEKDKNWHELIAAFVTPNDPEIITFIKDLDCDVVGYQLGEHEVLEQVKRIYEKLTEVDFKYVSISKDLVGLQSVQMPFQTLRPAGGNCIDGVLLFSSICEKSNIHSAIVFVLGHALFAFKTSLYGDEYYVLETTDISKKSFEDAIRDGFNRYRNEMKNNPENVFAIDVEKARKDGVMPLEKIWE
ncbi:MAG: HEAT repeat domain-containing protein [Methanophagales archaeon]|nr:HEAT repeat domain-containing protein [Methanophagales archaeon]